VIFRRADEVIVLLSAASDFVDNASVNGVSIFSVRLELRHQLVNCLLDLFLFNVGLIHADVILPEMVNKVPLVLAKLSFG